MTQRGSSSKGLALVIAVSMLACVAHMPVAAGDARLTGVVVASDGRPIAGATVHIASAADDGKVVSSGATGEDGRFSIAGVQPGSFQIGVEKGEALFVVDQKVAIDGGMRDVRVVVDLDARSGVTPAVAATKMAGVWDNPITAALVVVGGALVIGVLIEELDDDDEAAGTPSGN